MQLIIRENNEQEGESWIYVLDITEEERQLIIDGLRDEIHFNIIEVLDGPISDEEIAAIQKWVDTGYLDTIAKYRLIPKRFAAALEVRALYEYVFYKACGLVKI